MSEVSKLRVEPSSYDSGRQHSSFLAPHSSLLCFPVRVVREVRG